MNKKKKPEARDQAGDWLFQSRARNSTEFLGGCWVVEGL